MAMPPSPGEPDPGLSCLPHHPCVPPRKVQQDPFTKYFVTARFSPPKNLQGQNSTLILPIEKTLASFGQRRVSDERSGLLWGRRQWERQCDKHHIRTELAHGAFTSVLLTPDSLLPWKLFCHFLSTACLSEVQNNQAVCIWDSNLAQRCLPHIEHSPRVSDFESADLMIKDFVI